MPNIYEEFGLSSWGAEQVSFIQKGINQGLSANAIQKALSTSPIPGLRRQTVQGIISRLTNSIKNQSYQKSVNYDKALNPERIEPSPYGHTKAWNYVVKMEGIDTEGNHTTQYITITSDSFIPYKSTVVDMAEPYAVLGTSGAALSDYELTVDDIYTGSDYTGVL